MSARKSAQETQEPLSVLALLQLVAGPEAFAAALPLVREKMDLTPDRLAVLLVRLLNPDHVLDETEEALARKMSRTTLRGMKAAKELPPVIQGVVNSKA